MKAKADKERQTQLSKEFAKITSKGLTPVSIYDVDGKVVALTTHCLLYTSRGQLRGILHHRPKQHPEQNGQLL